ncbi:WhiB family transcriptional regulator [Streptomyces sp. NPDC088360]|uniref:WhiB family transcriptional regulator n=1 Tax=Streptomyces sp. NPDC088360 TaxID=3154515 RepID=UPI00344D7B50
MEWMTSALCAREDPELFFPVSVSGPALREELAAKRVCLRCPVLRPCLTWALDSGQAYGVWGGTSAEERAALVPQGRHEPQGRQGRRARTRTPQFCRAVIRNGTECTRNSGAGSR